MIGTVLISSYGIVTVLTLQTDCDSALGICLVDLDPELDRRWAPGSLCATSLALKTLSLQPEEWR